MAVIMANNTASFLGSITSIIGDGSAIPDPGAK